MSERINHRICEAGGDHANQVISDLADAAERSGDPISFWHGFTHFMSGAMTEHVGHESAASIQRAALELAATNGRGYDA